MKINKIHIDDIKTIYENKTNRGHWFDKDWSRFFKSRLAKYGYKILDNIYFISSEQNNIDDERLYTIRKMDKECDIESVDGFQKYKTSAQANRELKKILTDTLAC